MDEVVEQDFESHVRLVIDVLFASEENDHCVLDFVIERQILYPPNR